MYVHTHCIPRSTDSRWSVQGPSLWDDQGLAQRTLVSVAWAMAPAYGELTVGISCC